MVKINFFIVLFFVVFDLFSQNELQKPPKPLASDVIGERIVCLYEAQTYTLKNEVKQTVIGWEIENGRFAGSNYGKTVSGLFIAKDTVVPKPHHLIVWRESTLAPHLKSDTLKIPIRVPDLDLKIISTSNYGQNPPASNYQTYVLVSNKTGGIYQDAEIYEWRIQNAILGSVAEGHDTPNIKVLWNEFPKNTITNLIVTIRKCNNNYYKYVLPITISKTKNSQEPEISIVDKKNNKNKKPNAEFEISNVNTYKEYYSTITNKPINLKVKYPKKGNTYVYAFNDGSSVKLQNAQKVFSLYNNYYVSLLVTDVYGNQNTSNKIVKVRENHVSGSIYANKIINPEGNKAILIFLNQDHCTSKHYKWMKNNKALENIVDNDSIQVSEPGSYWVQASDMHYGVFNSSPISVYFGMMPDVAIEGFEKVERNKLFTLSAYAGCQKTEYQWSEIIDHQEIIISPFKTNNYEITQTVTNNIKKHIYQLTLRFPNPRKENTFFIGKPIIKNVLVQ